MRTFLVGGAVRDLCLGKEPKDKDYVIVGATPKDVAQLQLDGFTQVGMDFPVFLHPETGEEYALARKERKIGIGYHGFETITDSSITIEEDLIRRDLTINSMALDPETNEIIDPYGGQEDLKNGIIRHTSEAFSEDPLRVMRAVRFAARYNFKIHQSTLSLMIKLVDDGKLNELSKERIWIELEKMLKSENSDIAIAILESIGFFEEVMGIYYVGTTLFRLMTLSNSNQIADDVVQLFKQPENEIFKFVFIFYTAFTAERYSQPLFGKSAKMNVTRFFKDCKVPNNFIQAFNLASNVCEILSRVNLFDITNEKNIEHVFDIIKKLDLLRGEHNYNEVKVFLQHFISWHYSVELNDNSVEFGDIDSKLLQLVKFLKNTVNCQSIADLSPNNGKQIAKNVKDAYIKQATIFLQTE